MADDGEIAFDEFKLSDMVINPSIVMIAKRGSGKSWICRDILFHFKSVPGGIIISKTDGVNPFYGKFFPKTYIFFDFKTEVVENVLTRQKKVLSKLKIKNKNGKKFDPRTFILMDDCLASKGSWIKDQTISELLFNGRHYQIMYILTMQFPLGITPELRLNFDYVFLLKDDNTSNLKRIYDHYAGVFSSFYAFREVFGKLTNNYGSMVIVNRGAQENVFQKIFHYKAKDEKDFPPNPEFGCRQFMTFHRKNNDPEKDDNFTYNDNADNLDLYFDRKKKSKSKMDIRVNKSIIESSENKKY